MTMVRGQSSHTAACLSICKWQLFFCGQNLGSLPAQYQKDPLGDQNEIKACNKVCKLLKYYIFIHSNSTTTTLKVNSKQM